MKIARKFAGVLLAVLMTASAAVAPSAVTVSNKNQQAKASYVEGEIIAILKDSADKSYLSKSKAQSLYGSSITIKSTYTIDPDSKDNSKIRAVVLKSKQYTSKQLAEKVKATGAVKYVMPNRKLYAGSVTNDSYSDYQWALKNTGQNGGTEGVDVKADALWDTAAQSEKEQVVAIVDTGIDLENEELKDMLWTNPYGKKLVGKHGYDFTGTISDSSPKDDNGHGSHCAGIIAAQADNQKGISGINKSNVKIMALKFLESDGSGNIEDAIACFEYIGRAIDLGTNVTAINCSWSGGGSEDEKKTYDKIFDEFGKKGALTFVVAGNDSRELGTKSEDPDDDFFWSEYELPACSDSKYCVTVAASDENDKLAAFSNYGTKYVDVAAPGTDILSTVSYNCFNPTIYSEQQRSELCKYYQNYDGELSEGDFGYPKAMTPFNKSFTDKVVITQSDSFFGVSGKSISIKPETEPKKNKYVSYFVEMPFTLDDEEKNYSLSFCFKGDKYTDIIVKDVPADMDTQDVYDDISFDEMFSTAYTNGGDDWGHYYLDRDVEDSLYTSDTNRKLVFIVTTKGTVWIDDLAISNQDVSKDSFGKYDFYSGTSMATPYVTGAAALLKNAYPEATPMEIVNILKNTGRESEDLKGKVASGRTLCLDNTLSTPPMITSVERKLSKIEIKGELKDVTKVSVDGVEVSFETADDGALLISDTGYANNKKIEITVENSFGSDTHVFTLSEKKPFPDGKKYVMDAPYSGSGCFMIPVDRTSYSVDKWGQIQKITYRKGVQKYEFNYLANIDQKKLFDLKKQKNDDDYFDDEDNEVEIVAATCSADKIFFCAVHGIRGEDSYRVLGYEGCFGYYNLKTKKTVKLCELPDEGYSGAALAAYKGGIYLIGGYDRESSALFDTVYKYDSKKKEFTLKSAKLPEGRAYTKFVEYGGKLVGGWGAVESGEMPQILTFDGKEWKNSAASLKSDDYESGYEYYSDKDSSKELHNYHGSVGFGEGGVFFHGAVVDEIGDTFTYNVSKDSLKPSEYAFNKDSGGSKLVGVTVAGGFIAVSEYGDDYDDFDDDEDYYDDDDMGGKTYFVPLNNNQGGKTKVTLKTTSKTLCVGQSAKVGETITNPVRKTEYKSSNSKVVKVTSSGVLKALKKGRATVTVTNGGAAKKLTVTVKNPTLNKTSLSLTKGKSFRLKVKGQSGKITFSSSNKKVCSVSSKGVVKALRKGTAYITVKTNGLTLKCKVRVK